eukprot:gene1601-1010_t
MASKTRENLDADSTAGEDASGPAGATHPSGVIGFNGTPGGNGKWKDKHFA